MFKDGVLVARPTRHVGDHQGPRSAGDGGGLSQFQLFGETPREKNPQRQEEESERHVHPKKTRSGVKMN